MKELLQQYADYNTWANRILFDRISKLSEEHLSLLEGEAFSFLRIWNRL